MIRPAAPDRDEESSRWFAAHRRGVMSLEDREAFEVWRLEPANRAAFALMEESWRAIEPLREYLGGTEPASDSGKTKRSFARRALVAAMCAVSLGIGVLSYTDHGSFWTSLDWVGR